MRQNQYPHWGHDLVGVFFCALGCLALLAAPVMADPETTERAPPTLTEEAAIIWALERNPELAALRTQRGIAAEPSSSPKRIPSILSGRRGFKPIVDRPR